MKEAKKKTVQWNFNVPQGKERTRVTQEQLHYALTFELTEGGFTIIPEEKYEEGEEEQAFDFDAFDFDAFDLSQLASLPVTPAPENNHSVYYELFGTVSTISSKARPGILVERGFNAVLHGENIYTDNTIDFIDPYNRHPLGFIRVGFKEKPYAAIPYEFFVDVRYRDGIESQDTINESEEREKHLYSFLCLEVERAAYNYTDANRQAEKIEVSVDKGDESSYLFRLKKMKTIYFCLVI